MKTDLLLKAKTLVVLTFLGSAVHANSVADFDFTMRPALAGHEQQLRFPFVEWETLLDDTVQCPESAQGHVRQYEQGCVVVEYDSKTCRLYTPRRTTHSVLGGLVRHCFEGV